ncbi:YciI family protein [Curtobacterium sp. MCPF17_002]|uniref:YciI family protein n=1 Tax=Curtobacterium sp. MCPF17_002 TaxID=2175645 RepID=UPI000DA7599B|nr:YciI family protein [Curtobacterium sp. MCPF17_002]WIB77616.1 YciI family protein [Curtobacterium sp. MCPF17_002]
MSNYLISFDEGTMVFPVAELPAVSEATHAVVRDAKDAGVWVFGGGLPEASLGALVDTDGTVHDPATRPGKDTFIGGFCILDLPTRAEALRWAARFAEACRCAQEVREFMDDPES